MASASIAAGAGGVRIAVAQPQARAQLLFGVGQRAVLARRVDDRLQLGRQRPDDATSASLAGARSTSGRAKAPSVCAAGSIQVAPLPTSARMAPLPKSLNLPSLSENTACSLASQRALPLWSMQTLACAITLPSAPITTPVTPGDLAARAGMATKAATRAPARGVRCSLRDMEALSCRCVGGILAVNPRRAGTRRNGMRGFHRP
jgi:hypothetical protein